MPLWKVNLLKHLLNFLRNHIFIKFDFLFDLTVTKTKRVRAHVSKNKLHFMHAYQMVIQLLTCVKNLFLLHAAYLLLGQKSNQNQ